MTAQRRPLRLWVFLLGAALVLSGCATLDYRDIQRDFNAAVQGDNVRTAEALGALTSSNAERLYDDIRTRLTDERIRQLDDRLRPNAHAMRAVAEWRSGRLTEARATAAAGLKLPNAASSPRDHMVLEMVPAIVIDEELVTRFKQAGGSVSKKEYDDQYVRDFATATETMRKVTANARPSTPESIVSYVYLQRWRILQNWRVVISKIQDGPDSREAARQDAAQRLGAPLDAEIKRIEELIPAEDPIRRAMEAIRLR